MRGSPGERRRASDAREFDQFLRRLEVTKQKAGTPPPAWEDSRTDFGRDRADSSDNSTFESRNESAFRKAPPSIFDDANNLGGGARRGHKSAFAEYNDTDATVPGSSNNMVEPPTCADLANSFVERVQSQGGAFPYIPAERPSVLGVSSSGSASSSAASEMQSSLLQQYGDVAAGFFEQEDRLPDAILKLDRRQAIPTPRHNNDVLVEIEASSVDRRDHMVRPGVRCTESLPQGVETIGIDCVGRVVQVTTHARAVYGISVDDRVAAIYPFEYKDLGGARTRGGRRNTKYALVDAGFVVTVPKHVDAAEAACMIWLYMSAFQSIRLGYTCGLHARYDVGQLEGQSILVHDGNTELGRAIIDLAVQLGASQIFATGPTEDHPALIEAGAIPLGAETFGWELFIEEKINLVLVQVMPTEDNFKKFISILDENRGNLVYIHSGHRDDSDVLGITAGDVSCGGLQFQELVRKAKEAMDSARFSLILACSPQYIEYEGVWWNCKQNQTQFKEDLRFLFTLLGRRNLKPNVTECIGLEEVAGVQDRIEIFGKIGTIVCLPTALYEKKAFAVQTNSSPTRREVDQQGFPVVESDFTAFTPGIANPHHSYASDAGYVKATPACETLTDFNRMHDTRENMHVAVKHNMAQATLPPPQEVSPYSYSNFNNLLTDSWAAHHCPSYPSGSMDGTSTSLLSSLGHNSAANFSSGRTVLSASIPSLTGPAPEEEPPRSIQFRNRRARHQRAFLRQKRAKERSKRLTRHEKDGKEKSDEHDVVLGVPPPQEVSTVSPRYSAKKIRREARMRGLKGTTSACVEEDRSMAKNVCSTAVKTDATMPRIELTTVAFASVEEGEPVIRDANSTKIMHSKAKMREREEQTSAAAMTGSDAINGFYGFHSEESEASVAEREEQCVAAAMELEERRVTRNIGAIIIPHETLTPREPKTKRATISVASAMDAAENQLTSNVNAIEDKQFEVNFSRRETKPKTIMTMAATRIEAEEIQVIKINDEIKDVHSEACVVRRGPKPKVSMSGAEGNAVPTNVVSMKNVQNASGELLSETLNAATMSVTDAKNRNFNATTYMQGGKGDPDCRPKSTRAASASKGNRVTTNVNAMNARQRTVMIEKTNRHSDAVHQAVSSYRSHYTQLGNNERDDSRNEDESERDTSSAAHSFEALMSKWKRNDDMNRQPISPRLTSQLRVK